MTYEMGPSSRSFKTELHHPWGRRSTTKMYFLLKAIKSSGTEILKFLPDISHSLTFLVQNTSWPSIYMSIHLCDVQLTLLYNSQQGWLAALKPACWHTGPAATVERGRITAAGSCCTIPFFLSALYPSIISFIQSAVVTQSQTLPIQHRAHTLLIDVRVHTH